MRTASKLVRGVWLFLVGGGALSCALTMSFDGYDTSSSGASAEAPLVTLRGTVEGLEGDDAGVRLAYGATRSELLGNGRFEIPNALARGAQFRISAESEMHLCNVDIPEGTASSDLDLHVSCSNSATTLSALVLSPPAQLLAPFSPVQREVGFRAPLLHWLTKPIELIATPSGASAKMTVDSRSIEASTPTPIRSDGGTIDLTVTAKSGDAGTYRVQLHPVTFIKPSNAPAQATSSMTFGTSLATAGDLLVVGAPGEASGHPDAGGDLSAPSAGAVYVFARQDGAWTERAYLKAPTPQKNARFGSSIALDGDTLVVASPGTEQAFVYRLTGTSWSLEATLSAAPINRGFGARVAINGDVVVVGAPNDTSNATGVNSASPYNMLAYSSGAAHVFRRTGTTWKAEAYLKASNTYDDAVFGSSVAVGVDTIVVSAPGEMSAAKGIDGDQSNRSAVEAGAVYVFRWSGTAWKQEAYVKASDATAHAWFGNSVSWCGDAFVVTATGTRWGDAEPTSRGAAYVFRRGTGGVWTQEALLSPSNAQADLHLGQATACTGDAIVVSSTVESSAASTINGDQSRTGDKNGAAYVFQRSASAGSWSQLAYVKAWNSRASLLFGGSVAASDTTIAVSSPVEDTSAAGIFDPLIEGGVPANQSAAKNVGAVYVY